MNAAATGGGIIGALVLVAVALVDYGDLLPLSEPVMDWVRSIAGLVAFVGGSVVAGRRTQVNVETETTPLSSPMDAQGRPLIAKPSSEPSLDPPAMRRPRPSRGLDTGY